MPERTPSSPAARTSVHVLRHGEVDNPHHVLYGRLPGYHLSDLGHQMARVAGEYLSAYDVQHLVSSPLERAQETIAPLAQRTGLTPVLDERVIEAGNEFEGLTVGAKPQQLVNPKFWPKLINPLRPSWGEPYGEIVDRMSAAIRDARDAVPGGHAVIVSHQLPIWTIRQAAAGNRLWHDPRKRQCSLASVTTFVFDGEELAAVEYAEPAAALLGQASSVAGA
ncbi:histidine phosphatase family protein [Dermacoccaceae bacterium W4C1]